jgi:hypothetical protein
MTAECVGMTGGYVGDDRPAVGMPGEYVMGQANRSDAMAYKYSWEILCQLRWVSGGVYPMPASHSSVDAGR